MKKHDIFTIEAHDDENGARDESNALAQVEYSSPVSASFAGLEWAKELAGWLPLGEVVYISLIMGEFRTETGDIWGEPCPHLLYTVENGKFTNEETGRVFFTDSTNEQWAARVETERAKLILLAEAAPNIRAASAFAHCVKMPPKVRAGAIRSNMRARYAPAYTERELKRLQRSAVEFHRTGKEERRRTPYQTALYNALRFEPSLRHLGKMRLPNSVCRSLIELTKYRGRTGADAIAAANVLKTYSSMSAAQIIENLAAPSYRVKQLTRAK